MDSIKRRKGRILIGLGLLSILGLIFRLPFGSSLVQIESHSPHRGLIIEAPSLLPYLKWYQSLQSTAGKLAFMTGLICWQLFLFALVGIVASDYFTPNLAHISSKLGLSESVAGSTLLAFGNGSPDVFSTFASLGAGSGSLAIGELLGAAAFIVSVVAGVMTLVRPFKVARHTFIRDVGFFTVAVLFVLVILWDEKITKFEAGSMVVLYVTYVISVAVSSYWHNRKMRKEELLARARSQYAPDELSPALSHHDLPTFINSFHADAEQAAPNALLSPDVHKSPISFTNLDTPLDDDMIIQFTERSTPMTLTRQRSHGRNRSISHARVPMARSSVRPSLLGAIEFRDVINSLAADSSARTLAAFGTHLPDLDDSSDPSSPARPTMGGRARSGSLWRSVTPPKPFPVHGRSRSVANLEQVGEQASPDDNIWTAGDASTQALSRSQPELIDLSAGVEDPWRGAVRSKPPSPVTPKQALKLDIPTFKNGPALARQPSLRKVPSLVLTADSGQVTPLQVPSSPQAQSHHKTGSSSRFRLSRDQRQRVRFLTQSIVGTLFPSLSSLQDKSIIGGVVAIIVTPALFFLIITIPVIDQEAQDEVEGLGEKEDDLLANNVLSRYAGEDDDEGWRERAQQRDSHIAHVLHSPAAVHHRHHDMYSSPLDINQVDRGLNQAGDPDTRYREDADEEALASPPATPVEEILQYQADRQVSDALTILQCVLAPFFVLLALLYDQLRWWYFLVALGATALLGAVATLIIRKRRGQILLCFIGFAIAMIWLLMCVNEIIGVLQALGHVFGLSDSILGITVFALGNSTADLVANYTVAKLGFPVMAIAACYGGPLLNLLLGVGLSSTYYITKTGQPYPISFDLTLVTTCVGLLIILIATLVAVPMNGFMLSRAWGIFLISAYALTTAVSVFVEIRY